MQLLREVLGEENEQPKVPTTRLVEVMDRGQVQQLTREEVEALKERQDIRVADQGEKATILHKLRG